MNKQQILDNIIEVDSCWLWKGKRSERYGPFKQAYELFKGKIPKGLCLDHICNIKSCVNPNHLEPITQTENLKRKPQPARNIYPKKPMNKLTFDLEDLEVNRIRKLARDNDRSFSAQLRVMLKK